jgi:hypothetical protein
LARCSSVSAGKVCAVKLTIFAIAFPIFAVTAD